MPSLAPRQSLTSRQSHILRQTALIALAAIFVTGPSLAQTKARQHRHPTPVSYADERPPLTVNKRSFLDPGPVVPVGSMQNYMTANTVFSRTPDQLAQKSFYGNELLPAPLEVPGRLQPIFDFETPRID